MARKGVSSSFSRLKKGYERAKSMRTIGVAGGFIAAKPLNGLVFEQFPNAFGTDGGQAGNLFNQERLARTGFKVAAASIGAAMTLASKNDAIIGAGTGFAAGEIISITRDFGVNI